MKGIFKQSDLPIRRRKRKLAAPDGYKSNAERKYAAVLKHKVLTGEYTDWWHEPITLTLSRNNNRARRYTPDFMAVTPDGRITLIEVKGGFVREDADLKFEIAASTYKQFTFLMVQYVKDLPHVVKTYNEHNYDNKGV